MKHTPIIILFFIVALLAPVAVHAQDATPEPSVTRQAIVFPVAELGNCANAAACREYCNEVEHKDACTAFAKAKGLSRTVTLPEAAKAVLGCETVEACRTFCGEDENKDKCREFARVHGLRSEMKNPQDRNVLERAREILGCESVETCRTLCQESDNHEKCQNFAREAGLKSSLGVRKMERVREPDGLQDREMERNGGTDGVRKTTDGEPRSTGLKDRREGNEFNRPYSEDQKEKNEPRESTSESETENKEEVQGIFTVVSLFERILSLIEGY